MLIEIESAYGDKHIRGKRLTHNELDRITRDLIVAVGERGFVSAFCSRYGHEEIPFSPHVMVDYVIDLDTHMILKPKY